MTTLLECLLVWYLVGVGSTTFWLLKLQYLNPNKLDRIYMHFGFVAWTGCLGPIAFLTGYIGFVVNHME